MCATEISVWVRHIVLVGALFVGTGSGVLAQSSQSAQPTLDNALEPGRTVWITDSVGHEERMRIVGVSGNVVTATVGEDTRQLSTMEIVRVRARRTDSVLNGALTGAGAALAAGLYLCNVTEPWANCRDDFGPMFRIGALGAGIGIGVDALIRGRTTIYERERGAARLQAAPIVGRHAGGLQVSLSF
jgi:hypothetical protein